MSPESVGTFGNFKQMKTELGFLLKFACDRLDLIGLIL